MVNAVGKPPVIKPRLAAQTVECSVVVPTFRRDEELRRLLETLAAQDVEIAFEVIVVDDACSITTPAVVAEVRQVHPGLRLSLLEGKSRGPASARNRGWRRAVGQIIAFVDDDAYPADTSWLRQGLAALRDPSVAGVCGPVRVPVSGTPTDFQRNVMHLETGTFLTCNAFYRRTWLERVGGFDERFRVPFREDSDLQFRVEAAGGRLIRSGGPVMIHPAPPGRFAVSLRLQRYSMYNALIYKKHPARFRAELEARPPRHYYAIIAFLCIGVVALLLHRYAIAAVSAAMWSLLEARFFWLRANGTSHSPVHVADLALTSLLIPPLSVYWRLRGAIRFRVLFL